MDKQAELGNAFYNAIKRVTRGYSIADGIVSAVDESAFTCDITTNNSQNDIPVTYYEVPLKVLVGAQASLIEIPNIGSKCLICFRDGSTQRPQILAVHDSLKILVLCGETTIEISSNGIVFNNGQLGGLVKLNDLVNRLNILESDINTLKAAFTSWVVVPNDGGGALKTAAAAWYAQELQLTQAQQLSNDKIKQ